MYLKIYRKNTHKTLLEIIKRNVVGGGGGGQIFAN